MERPNSPSVEPSEPEKEKRMMDSAVDEIKTASRRRKVHLSFVRDTLLEVGLDVDDEGFIVDEETGDYAVPYQFSRDRVREYVKDEDESVFDAFFVPTNDDNVYRQKDRLHLSDMHATLILENGDAHPVPDDWFELSKFHAALETGFPSVTAWSDLVRDGKLDGSSGWISIEISSDAPLELNCFGPECNYSGSVSEWEGEIDDPECPECEGNWDEHITVCMACQEWHWGTNFEGESRYAEPACPDCGAGVAHLEQQTRYDEFEEL